MNTLRQENSLKIYNNLTSLSGIIHRRVDSDKLGINDRNACAVFALSSSLDIPFTTAQDFARAHWGRIVNKGTNTYTMLNSLKNGEVSNTFGFSVTPLDLREIINTYKVHGKIILRKMKVKSFIKKNPKGTFYICVNRHAFTIRDGVIYDCSFRSFINAKVRHVFKIG